MRDRSDIDVCVEDAAWSVLLGEDAETWAARTLAVARLHAAGQGAVAIALVDDEVIRALNGQWRGKNQATNVLSFPAAPGFACLGDIALASGVVSREAAEQGKLALHHATHLLVHGYLHLLGHDHETDDEADAMESLERKILAALNIADPYREPMTTGEV
jgi:probable rRNA maturation factor